MIILGMNWIKKHRFITGIIILTLLGGFYYFFSFKNGNDVSQVRMEKEKVTRGNLEVFVTGSGQVEAQSQVDLKPVVAGDAIEVTEVYVENDEEVFKDQVIALLDSENAQKSIRDAEISLRSAQIQLEQTEHSNDTETIEDKWTRQLQEISVQQKINSLSDAKEDLEDYYIKAPFEGVVTDLAVEAGDTISQTNVLASVITKNMIASITLNEVDAAQVQVGNKAILAFDALPDVTAEGEVSKVDTIGEVESGVVSYGVEITFEAPSEYLKPGMSVNSEIQIESREDVLVISSSAIQTDDEGNEYVLIISQDDASPSQIEETSVEMSLGNRSATNKASLNRFKRIQIETGISNDTQTEVIGGISEGDVIVVSSSASSSSSDNSDADNSSGLFNMGGKPGGGRGQDGGKPQGKQ